MEQMQDPRNRAKAPGWFVAALVLITVILCVGCSWFVWDGITNQQAPDTESEAPNAAAASAAVALTTVTRPPFEPAKRIGDGEWLVGIDIAPGTWVAKVPPGDGCMWLRENDSDDPARMIIAGDVVLEGKVKLKIPITDHLFSTTGCGEWQLQE